MSRLISETGKIYGRWTVLGLDMGYNGHAKWNCLCDPKRGGCGKTFSVYGHLLRLGRTHGCSVCNNVPPIAIKLENGLAAKRRLFAAYKKNANKNQRSFELKFDEFVSLCQEPCFYCDEPPSQRFAPSSYKKGKLYISNGEFVHNGIDRIDNNKGYVLTNCRPCCWICNVAKRDMTEQQFAEWLSSIHINIGHIPFVPYLQQILENKSFAAKRRLFSIYKKQAKKRNLLFELDFDALISLCQEPCFYCGCLPNKTLRDQSRWPDSEIFIYNGIDRTDNSKGYIPSNCRTCCWTCNNAKMDMTEKEFTTWASKAYTHFVLCVNRKEVYA